MPKYSKVDTKTLQNLQMKIFSSMKNGNKKQMVSNMEFRDDFANFYGATEDIMASSGSGELGDSASLSELDFLSSKRIGVGNNITQGFSEDALFNWFDPKKIDSKNIIAKVPGFKKWVVDTDLKNQSIAWNTDKRKFGIAFLVKFWTSNDVDSGRISQPAPNKPPRRFQVISPLYLAPTNTFDTRMLDYDEEVWEFHGGNIRVSSIHKSRVEVLRGPPQTGSYRGLSVIEPIYLSLICYYNILINITRAVSKWGTVVPVMKSGTGTPTVDEYTEFLALMTEFVMNNFFMLGKDDQLEFNNTGIGAGIHEMAEVFKEDISSGSRIPLNELFGRTEAGGISGSGALTAERKYLNLFSNEQTKISDDFLRIFNQAGFDFEGKDLKWNLSLQKTSEQQLLEESMELQNEMMKQQLKMQKQENSMMKMQTDLFSENKDQFNAEQQLESAEQIKEDFANIKKRRYDDFKKLQQMISLRGKA